MTHHQSGMSNALPRELVGGRYRIDSMLGRGGMGTVYRADDLLGGVVALKRLHASVEEVTRDETSTAGQTSTVSGKVAISLAHEFRTLSSLRHPNVISVLDYGFDAQHRPYLTMELLEQAQTLAQMARDKPYPARLQLLTQVLQALVYLHRRGVIHRDLKPANVLVVNEQVKVLDFGISLARGDWRSNNLSPTAGTPGYVAPELFQGEAPSQASDLYSFGLMAAQLLSCHPLTERNPRVLLASIDKPAVTRVLRRLLDPKPWVRYSSAEEVIDALREATGQPLVTETAATRESFLQAARYVGREEERKRLVHSLDEALAGRGGAWLIGGESGIGKSRFIELIRAQAQVKGALVLRGQAVNTGGSPYEDWRPVLRWLVLLVPVNDLEAGVLKPLIPDIDSLLRRPVPDAPGLSADMAQDRLVGAVETLFARLAQPTLLLMEDLQWVSDESLRLLARLSAQVRVLPLLVVATYRNDERPTLPQSLLAMQVLSLSRLSPREIEELSESMLGVSGRAPPVLELLQRETEGNPFFLVEVVRALAEEAGQLERIGTTPLPEQVFAGGMQQLIQRRLARVPPVASELLRLAAVMGRYLDLEVLRAAAHGMDVERWLEECAGAAVLDLADGRWRFAHDKLREQALAALPTDHRSILHRQAAEAIERTHAQAPEWWAALAHHWGAAKNTQREAHYAQKAGEQAMSVNAYHAAVPYLRRALELASTDKAAHLGHLEGLLAEAQFLIGDLKTCVTHSERSLMSLGWPVPTSTLGWRLGLVPQLLKRLLQATAPQLFLEKHPERRQLRLKAGRIVCRMGEALFYHQQIDRLIWSGLRLINLLEPGGPSVDLARGYVLVATLMSTTPVLRPRVEAWCHRALEMAEQTGNPADVAFVLVRCGVISVGYAEWKKAEVWLNRARELAIQVQDFRSFEEACSLSSLSWQFQGKHQQCLEDTAALEKSARKRGAVQTHYWGIQSRGLSLILLGRIDEAMRETEAALPEIEAQSLASEIVRTYGTLALGQLRRGDEVRALEMADKGLTLLRGMMPVAYWLYVAIFSLAEVYLTVWERRGGALVAGEEKLVGSARAACKSVRAFGRALVFGQPLALLCSGREAWLSGKQGKAQRLWRNCAVRAAELEVPFEEGNAYFELGRHLPLQDPERQASLLRAREIFAKLGVVNELARTETELLRSAPRRNV